VVGSRLFGATTRSVNIGCNSTRVEHPFLVRSAPPAEALPPPDHAQSLRGWFYRAIAPSSECAILEVGDAGLANWFANVVRGNLTEAAVESGRFDVVAVHHSLGGCATLQAALRAARRELREGGVLALTGANRLRSGGSGGRSETLALRATGWGFRTEAMRAGFADVSLYVMHPPARAPIYVIDANPRTARAFFRAQIAGQPWPAWSAKRILLDALVAANLMPYLQPEFIVVGRKC